MSCRVDRQTAPRQPEQLFSFTALGLQLVK